MFVYGFPEHGEEILKREYKRYSRVTRKEKSRKLNEKNGKETQITRRWKYKTWKGKIWQQKSL